MLSLVDTIYFFFFFNDTATTEIYTLSLHDALPIYIACCAASSSRSVEPSRGKRSPVRRAMAARSRAACGLESADRKSTRLNSSHSQISYAVFCLKKKKKRNEVLHRENVC